MPIWPRVSRSQSMGSFEREFQRQEQRKVAKQLSPYQYLALLSGVVVGVPIAGGVLGVLSGLLVEKISDAPHEVAAPPHYDLNIRGVAHRSDGIMVEYQALVTEVCTDLTVSAATVVLSGELIIGGAGIQEGAHFKDVMADTTATDCNNAIKEARGNLSYQSPIVRAVGRVATDYDGAEYSVSQVLGIVQDMGTYANSVELVIPDLQS